MVKNFEDLQTVGKENVEATLKSFGALSKSGQAIAVELADYSKKAFEDGSVRPREAARRQVAGQGDRGADRICQDRIRRLCRRSDQAR